MFENREIWDYRDAAYDPVTGQAVRSLQIFFVSRRADSVSFSYWLSWVYSSVMSAASQLHRTEEFLHQQIPITSAMGVRVAAYDGGQLILPSEAVWAPLRRSPDMGCFGSSCVIAVVTS